MDDDLNLGMVRACEVAVVSVDYRLDAAKLVALLTNSEQPLEHLYGTDKARGKRVPLVLMPTTSGTCSEVTWVSVITDPQNKKQAVYSPQLLPDVAILDPLLTLGLPPKVTAATGLDAMVHAIEAYTSRTRKNPISDGLAVTDVKHAGFVRLDFRIELSHETSLLAACRIRGYCGAS